MKYKAPHLLLALATSARGFGFVVFAGPDRPFDWGLKEICGSQKNPLALAAIKKLVERYDPQVIVIEDTKALNARRGVRSRSLYRLIARLAYRKEIILKRYARQDVRAVFCAAGLHSKFDIARAVAARIPAFAHRLPRSRNVSTSEDHRQPLFDAAALGITYFARKAARLPGLNDGTSSVGETSETGA